jgi:hypothetical protein
MFKNCKKNKTIKKISNKRYKKSDTSKKRFSVKMIRKKKIYKGGEFNKEEFGIKNIKTDLQSAKKARAVSYVAAQTAKAATFIPGAGSMVAAILDITNSMAKAYTNNIKFKALVYKTMFILVNCYKIYTLIERSTNIFLIAIYNRDELSNLFNYVKENKNLDETFEKKFEQALEQAKNNKKNNKKDKKSPEFLLYNIHQNDEIKKELNDNMQELMVLLLKVAPDSVITSLYFDNKLNEKGFNDIVNEECKRREKSKNNFVCKDIKNSQTIENNIENKVKNSISKYIKKSFIDNSIINNIKLVNKIADAEENMEDTINLLTVINGLFNNMKSQYDEIMKYYEKHLDIILDNKNEQYINIKLKNKDYNNEPTIFEKTNFIIENSNEYMNFLIPPSSQLIVDESIQNISSDFVEMISGPITDKVEEDVEKDKVDDIIDTINEQKAIETTKEELKEEINLNNISENNDKTKSSKKKKGIWEIYSKKSFNEHLQDVKIIPSNNKLLNENLQDVKKIPSNNIIDLRNAKWDMEYGK